MEDSIESPGVAIRYRSLSSVGKDHKQMNFTKNKLKIGWESSGSHLNLINHLPDSSKSSTIHESYIKMNTCFSW